MRAINYISLCSGIGAECEAFKRLCADYPTDIRFNLLAWSEIDLYACASHDSAHPEYAGNNVGDMTTVDWDNWKTIHGLPPIDLLFYSTPCQSVSNAGKHRGMKKGDDQAASALIWHTEKAIASLKPKCLILENVKGMVNKRNKPDFDQWRNVLEGYGYANYWQVLNSKHYGTPQNRERVFMISLLTNGSESNAYKFPDPFQLKKRLRDVLEENVDESYYLSDLQVERILAHCERKQAAGCGFKYNFQDPSGISGTITGNYGQRETDTYLKVNENIIPINTTKDGLAPCLPSHYYKAGWSDFTPKQHNEPARHLAVFVIDEIVPQNKEIIGEPKIMQIGSYSPSSACNAKVLDPDGICPALLNHKGAEPAILTPIRTETQRQLRKQGIDTFGGRQLLPRTDGLSNTITTVQKDNLLAVPIKIRQATRRGYTECPAGGGFDASYPNSNLRRGRVQQNGDIVGAITASGEHHCVYEGMEPCDPCNRAMFRYRIRKLTPRECGRLMSFGDDTISRIINTVIRTTLKNGKVKEKPMPKTQLYKLWGNSIDVNVVYHILKKLYVQETIP